MEKKVLTLLQKTTKIINTIKIIIIQSFQKNIIDIGGGVNPIFYNKNIDIMDIKISKKIKKKF